MLGQWQFLWSNVPLRQITSTVYSVQSETKILFPVLHTAVCSSRTFRTRILGKTWLLKKEVNITYKTKLKTCSSYTEEEDEEEEEEEKEEEVEALPEAERPGLAFPSLWSLVNQLSIGIPNIMGKSFVKGNDRGPLKNIILLYFEILTFGYFYIILCKIHS